MYPIQVVLSQSASYLHQDDIRLFLRFTESPPIICPMYCQSNNWWRFRKILWPSRNIWTLQWKRDMHVLKINYLVPEFAPLVRMRFRSRWWELRWDLVPPFMGEQMVGHQMFFGTLGLGPMVPRDLGPWSTLGWSSWGSWSWNRSTTWNEKTNIEKCEPRTSLFMFIKNLLKFCSKKFC